MIRFADSFRNADKQVQYRVIAWAVDGRHKRPMRPLGEDKTMFKKIMIAGLMTATMLSAIPAQAQRTDGDGQYQGQGRGDRGGRESRGDNGGGNRGNWQARQQQAQPQVQVQQQQQTAPQQRYDRGTPYGSGARQPDRQAQIQQQQVPQQRNGWQGNGRDANRDGRPDTGRWNGNGRTNGAANWNDRNRDGRDDRRDWNQRDNRWNQNGGDWNRGNDRPRIDNRQRWSNQRQWSNNWRNDRRYDWRSYRNTYGDVFRSGSYYAPRGWSYGYRPFSVGIYLDSLLYSNSYWLDDPYAYRLPPAYGTLRWVRYYDDAMLVDIRDGYVVDVIRDFFW